MIYVTEAILIIPVSAIMAAWHAHLIKQGRKIDHVLWALVYAAAIAGGLYWQRAEVHSIWQIGCFALACAAGRLPVFNVLLNIFRGKARDYTSMETTSLADHIEARLFGKRVWLVDVVAIAFLIPLQFFI